MFSLKLKILREERGLSQQAFATRMGISQSTVGMWESGKREPNFNTVQKIADFFNVSVDYLLGRSEDTALNEALSKEEFALFGEIRDLTTAEKEDVLSFIRFTKSKRTDESET